MINKIKEFYNISDKHYAELTEDIKKQLKADYEKEMTSESHKSI